MAPPISNRWTTDPEYIDLLNYLIKRTENVESPMRIKQMAKEFKKKSKAAHLVNSLTTRIASVRTRIHSFEHIDTNTKVKLLFALSASVDANVLKRMKKEAFVEVDEKKQITHFKAKDGTLELKGDHSLSAKCRTAQLESKGSLRSLIADYFETRDDADATPNNKEEKEMWNLIEFITENCVNVVIPLSIDQLAKDFNGCFGISIPLSTIRTRIIAYCREIQKVEFLDTQTKVQQLFGLSATIDSDCLKELRKNAQVEVDEKNRITYYKAINGSLELRGVHHLSAKIRTGKLESKRGLRSMINSYFENKNDADVVSNNKKESEMWQLIEFFTEKCQTVDSPLNITQLTKDFNKHFGFSRTLYCIHKRIQKYCHEIQKAELLDPSSKLKQLFGLSATLDSDYLEKLRKDAVVKVDSKYRITEYTSNDGRLKLKGRDWWSNTVEKNEKKNLSDNEELNDSSDGYSSEEFDSEFDSDDENDHPDNTEDHMELSNETDDCDHETPVRNRSPTEISIIDNRDFDIPSERSYGSEKTGMGGDKKNDSGIGENLSFKTRSGRLSKKRHLDFSDNQSNSGTNSATVTPAKQRKRASEHEQAVSSSNQSRSSLKSRRRSTRNSQISSISTDSGEKMENQDDLRVEDNPSDYHNPRIQEMEDYDYNPREDNTSDSSPIDNCLEEPEPPTAEEHNSNIDAQNTHNRSDAVASEPHPEKESLVLQNETISTPQTNGNNKVTKEVPIKVEQEEVPTEGVKPKTIYNSKLKFFKSMQSLILFLNAPSLSNVQSKIHQKIRKIGRSDDMISNDELIPVLELLVARMANHSVIDISEGVESVGLIQFFCYLKASILNSKMAGVEGLVENIGKRIEESQNKRYAVEKVANALSATLDIDGY